MDSQRFDRVAAVFEGARELAGEARVAFLDSACNGDDALRFEVESLLAEYGRSDGELEPVVHASALRRWVSETADGLGDEGPPPIEVPGYRILSLIGEGGQGAVYEAEQLEPPRVVALKLLQPHLGGSSLERRFEREARVLARLQHPGIATILGSGVVESAYGPLPYFALELIRGRTLVVHCEEHRLGPAERMALLVDVCDAVEHAHSKGIVHRDLKPSNVLVDEQGRARVLDFGIARVLDADVEHATLETHTGQVIGTLAYMSPEQAGGQPDDVDEQTDVFALGVLAFELLTGELPRDLAGRPIPEQLLMLASGETTLLGSLNRSLKGDLETIVAKAMAQEKSRRYRSASALAGDIRRYLRSEPILARRATVLYQMSRFVRRNRALSVSFAALALVLVVGTLVSLTLYMKGRVSKAEALWQSYVANLTAAGAQLDAGTGGVTARLEHCPEEYRSTWEWRHLWRRSDASLAQAGSESMVHSVALDGQGLLASGGGRELPGDYGAPDFRVFLWELDANEREIRPVRTLDPAHGNAVRGLAFRPGGDELVSLSRAHAPEVPGEVHLWRASDGTRLASVDCEANGLAPTSVAWLSSGTESARIAIGCLDGVHLWEPDNEQLTPLLPAANVNVLALQKDAESTRLLVADAGGSVGIWDLGPTGEVALRRRVDLADHVRTDAESYSAGVTALADGPDGRRFLAGLEGGALVLIDTEGGENASSLQGHTRTVTALRWSADGRFAWSTSLDKTLRRWDLERLECVEVYHGHAGYVTALDGLTDPPLLVTGAYDRTLRVWDARGRARVFRAEEGVRNGIVYSLAFNPDGDALAWRPEKFHLAVSDLATGATRFSLPPFIVDNPTIPEKYRGLIVGTSFGSQGDSLHAVHAYGGRLRRFDAHTGELEATLGPELLTVSYVNFSKDGSRYAASVEVDGGWHVQVRSLDTGEVEPGCSWPTESTSFTVAFTPDGHHLIHSYSRSILVRNALTGEVQRRMELPFEVNHLACSPDGTYLAATSYEPDDRVLYVFELATGALRIHEGNVQPFSLTFLPDSTRVVTGNRDDGTVSLWDIERGLTLTLRDLEGTIQWVAASPDGRRVAAVDSAGVHRVWDAGPVRGSDGE